MRHWSATAPDSGLPVYPGCVLASEFLASAHPTGWPISPRILASTTLFGLVTTKSIRHISLYLRTSPSIPTFTP
jgi:hypothetical protein